MIFLIFLIFWFLVFWFFWFFWFLIFSGAHGLLIYYYYYFFYVVYIFYYNYYFFIIIITIFYFIFYLFLFLFLFFYRIHFSLFSFLSNFLLTYRLHLPIGVHLFFYYPPIPFTCFNIRLAWFKVIAKSSWLVLYQRDWDLPSVPTWCIDVPMATLQIWDASLDWTWDQVRDPIEILHIFKTTRIIAIKRKSNGNRKSTKSLPEVNYLPSVYWVYCVLAGSKLSPFRLLGFLCIGPRWEDWAKSWSQMSS